jgi:hypothetical protein
MLEYKARDDTNFDPRTDVAFKTWFWFAVWKGEHEVIVEPPHETMKGIGIL